MPQHDSITKIQLSLFRNAEQTMSVGESAFICDDFSSPIRLPEYVYDNGDYMPFPFKLTFSSAIVCTRGELNAVINQRELNASRGDVLIVQYGSIVESLTGSSNLKTISMAFVDTDEGRLFNRPAEELGNWLTHRSIPVSLHLEEKQLLRYLNLYNQIKEIHKEAAFNLKEEVVKGFISILVASFLSIPQMTQNKDIAFQPNSRHDEVFLRFMDDLQLFANSERSVSFYADRLCISPKHFSKLIRLASGKLPMEHIQQRVIIEAKTMLRTTDMTIREIADALNFPTDSFFCRYFKHETGCSPSEYRRK